MLERIAFQNYTANGSSVCLKRRLWCVPNNVSVIRKVEDYGSLRLGQTELHLSGAFVIFV